MAGWTLDPWIFIATKPALVPFYRKEDAGFFHVTTRASAVAKAKRLKSRAELDQETGGGQTLVRGLGGGPSDVISVTFSLDRAKALWEGMRSLSRAVRGETSFSELYGDFFDWTGFPEDPIWKSWLDDPERSEDQLRRLFDGLVRRLLLGHTSRGDLDEMKTARFWREEIRDLEPQINDLSPPDVYEAINGAEAFLDAAMEGAKNSKGQGPELCTRMFGFHAPFRSFVAIEPDEISIVQLSCKTNAKANYIVRECELRIPPKDLKIVMNRVEERGHLLWT